MGRGASWGEWEGWPGGVPADESYGQTCWQPAGRGKGRSSKRALCAPGSASCSVAPTHYAGRGGGGLERGGGSAGGGGTPGPRGRPCRPRAGGRLPRLQDPKSRGLPGLSLRPQLQPRPPKVQNICKVCSAPQACVPGVNGCAYPASVLRSVRPARAARLGVQGRAESERAGARLQSPRRNPRPPATVLGIDGSISAF